MAAMVNRIGLRSNTSSSILIHCLKRPSPSRKLYPLNSSFYSTDSARSASEEFSLRYLDGKHEGLYNELNQLVLRLRTEFADRLIFSLQDCTNSNQVTHKGKSQLYFTSGAVNPSIYSGFVFLMPQHVLQERVGEGYGGGCETKNLQD